MSEALDKVLAEQDRTLAINQFFQDKLGATAGQAEIASRSLADRFKLVGATLMFGDKLAGDAVEDLTAHLKRQGYEFLLPGDAEDLTKHVVDPALLDKAFVQGSPDARAEVLRGVGRDAAKLDKLAQDFGLRDSRDYRKGVGKRPEKDAASAKDGPKTPNPWSAEHWNVTAQGAVYRRSPSIARSLAESAGSRIAAACGVNPKIIARLRRAARESDMRKQKIGEVKAGRLPIISRQGDVVGNVGPKATQATVARFLGHHGARLGVHTGRKAWIEQGTNSRPRPVRRPSADYKHSRGSVRA